MNTTTQYLVFDVLDESIELKVDQRFVDALPIVFPNWPYSLKASANSSIFASIEYLDGKYFLNSPYMENPKSYRDPVNTLCSLIVELAWERLREDTRLLCLHGAAIEFAGRLVILPSTRGAGKSTLAVALAAAGKKLFTDDFLPLSIAADGQLRGVSSGISPRLRLPVPDQMGQKAQQLIANRSFISNKQYKYVALIFEELAKFGETAPIGSIVFLERSDNAEPKIESVSGSDALNALIKQNFSRAMNSAGILKLLAFIADSTPAYRLKYDYTDDAVELLEKQFQVWPEEVAKIDKNLDASLFENVFENEFEIEKLDITQGQFIHAKCVTEIERDGKRFLTGQEGKSIHYLNEGAATIWRLLEEPTSLKEAVEMLCAVYPDHPADDIRRDITSTFTEFANNSMLQKVPPNCQTSEIEANLSV